MISFEDNFSGYKNLPYKGVRLPQFDIDKKYYERLNISDTVDNFTFLEKVCEQRMIFLQRNSDEKYKERLNYELSLIKELGFTDYFILVWDIINFARENNIAVGPGRGSGAGSLVLYLLQITKIDPIKYGLIFERFINKARAKREIVDGISYFDGDLLPDVDSDFCFYRRHEVIEYIKNKFPGRTSKILTVSTFSGKKVIKDVFKIVLQISEKEAQIFSDKIERKHGLVCSLKETWEENGDFRDEIEHEIPEGKKYGLRDAFNIACKLEDLPSNFGIHASAMAISYEYLDTICPVQVTKQDGQYELVSGFDMKGVAKIAVKVDALGLKTASIVDEVAKNVNIDLDKTDLDSGEIYEPLQDLDTPYGIFQIEAPTQYNALKKIKPKNLLEVSDLMALARPGALAYIKDYADFKFGERKHVSINEKWDEILKETKFLPLYQESMMRLCHELFGFTLEDAEILRRIIGKKQVKEMPAWKDKIYKAAEKKGLSKEVADAYWKVLDDSSSYSFNKCLCPYTTFVKRKISSFNFEEISIKDVRVGDYIMGLETKTGNFNFVKVINIHRNFAVLHDFIFVGYKKEYAISCSLEHKFLTKLNGEFIQVPIKKIIENKLNIYVRNGDNYEKAKLKSWQPPLHIKYLQYSEVETIDLEVAHSDHNFIANNIIVSNSHSVAYATLAMQCVYLKWNYPQEFFLSLLKMATRESDPQSVISSVSQELPKFGIKLLPPDLIKSETEFVKEGKDIRYGLLAVKGFKDKAKDGLEVFKGDYKDKYDLFLSAKQNKISIGKLSSLIQSGALDSIGIAKSRSYLVLEAQVFNKLTDREKRGLIVHVKENNNDLFETIKYCVNNQKKDEKGKLIFSESRWKQLPKGTTDLSQGGTIQRDSQQYLEIYLKNSKNEKLANWYFEKQLLGYSYSTTLHSILRQNHPRLISLENIERQQEKTNLDSCGYVLESIDKASKKGDPMLTIMLEDGQKTSKIIFFGKKYASWKEKNTPPKEDDIILFSGTKSGDICFVNNLTILSDRIYMRLSELKEND